MKKTTSKKIPVAKHVKKFLVYYFPEPYTLSTNDYLGPIFISLLKRGFKTSVVKKGEATFEIKFKDYYLDRFGKVISWDNVIAFNKAVDQIFRSQLFNHMDLTRKLENQFAKQSMIQFLEEFNITENDINYETLYTDYKRKKIYSKKTFQHIGNQLIKNNFTDLSL